MTLSSSSGWDDLVRVGRRNVIDFRNRGTIALAELRAALLIGETIVVASATTVVEHLASGILRVVIVDQCPVAALAAVLALEASLSRSFRFIVRWLCGRRVVPWLSSSSVDAASLSNVHLALFFRKAAALEFTSFGSGAVWTAAVLGEMTRNLGTSFVVLALRGSHSVWTAAEFRCITRTALEVRTSGGVVSVRTASELEFRAIVAAFVTRACFLGYPVETATVVSALTRASKVVRASGRCMVIRTASVLHRVAEASTVSLT